MKRQKREREIANLGFLIGIGWTITRIVVHGGTQWWRWYRRCTRIRWRWCTTRLVTIVAIRRSWRWYSNARQFNLIQTYYIVVNVLVLLKVRVLRGFDIILDVVLYPLDLKFTLMLKKKIYEFCKKNNLWVHLEHDWKSKP